MGEVIATCGHPTSKTDAGTEDKGHYNEDIQYRGKGSFHVGGTYRGSSQGVETWYYDQGPRKLVKILTFEGVVLKKIKNGPYGKRKTNRKNIPVSTSLPKVEKSSIPSSDFKQDNKAAIGNISISGSPHGAKVYLDEYHAGDIPCTIEQIEVGPHNIMVKKEDYQDWKKRIIVKPHDTLFLDICLEAEESEVNQVEGPPIKNLKAYKWTDEKGNVHITNIPR